MRFDDKQFLAEQINIHRKKAGLTQAQLAEKVDLSPQHISRIESGCYIPSLKSFFMIVNELNIDLQIFGFNISKNENPRKEKLMKEIAKATDAEIIFYQNLIEATNESLSTIKKNLF